MDYNRLINICDLYDQELKLLDECNADINNENKFKQLQECHEKYCELLGDHSLAGVYEKVRGLNHPTTIDLYFEEAEKLEDDYELMIPIYQHVLKGCNSLYGETGEKTIECKLQIAVCIRSICEQREDEQETFIYKPDCEYSYKMVLQILEELFLQNHEHPLYGTFISTMLCDEYVREGNKKRALEIFEKWSRIHPLENVRDIEELNAWIEYTLLLAELGWFKISVENVEGIRRWMDCNLSEYDDEIPYLSRRISEIYVSNTLYQEAINLLESVKESELCYSAKCEEEFLNVKFQLAHCYNLNGNRIKAAINGFELQKELNEKGIRHPSKFLFDNLMSNISGSFGDHYEQYDKLLKVYNESKRSFGENNEETILYEMNLGKACFEIYYEVDDRDKEKYINDAEYYLEDAYRHSEKGSGKGNLFSILIKRNLAEVKAEKGDVFTAISMLEDVWHKNAAIYSEDNLETVDAKMRYAALCLETQQVLDEIPEWLAELNPESIFEECYLTKKKFLGITHWETIDALYWYARSVQSNELIENLQRRTLGMTFEKSFYLHRLLLLNVANILEQAFYINSIEKQSAYMSILEDEFLQIFWLLTNCLELGSYDQLEEFYEMIAGYKNLSYDMQYQKLSKADEGMRKKFAESLSIDTEIIEYLYRNTKYTFSKDKSEESLVKQISQIFYDTNEVFVDFWQEANVWNVFIIDRIGIKYKRIDFLNDDEIPNIDDDMFNVQPQLDENEYTLEESLEWALFIANHLSNELNGYYKVYFNLHKQLHQFPISSFVYKLTGIPSVIVSSVYQILNLKKETNIREVRIGFIEDGVSLDHRIVKRVIQNTNSISKISRDYNVISISGHGFYDDDIRTQEGKRNYIEIEGNHRIYIQDVISENLTGVELAFLPVCQSGNGTVYRNFGSYSIGKAFRMAGVGYTIETLWDVSLSASLIFEYEFFQYLKKIKSIEKAFFSAIDKLRNYTSDNLKQFCKLLLRDSYNRQLARILYSETLNGYYPFKESVYWAGFSLQKGEK